jgi:hypothetical protein
MTMLLVCISKSIPILCEITDVPTAKTTDENLTGENWELILNLCDKVQEDGENG